MDLMRGIFIGRQLTAAQRKEIATRRYQRAVNRRWFFALLFIAACIAAQPDTSLAGLEWCLTWAFYAGCVYALLIGAGQAIRQWVPMPTLPRLRRVRDGGADLVPVQGRPTRAQLDADDTGRLGEDTIAGLLAAADCDNARRTGGPNDGGLDAAATNAAGRGVFVQSKVQTAPVGPGKVREFAGCCITEGYQPGDVALLVTTSRFTGPARRQARRTAAARYGVTIQLIDGPMLNQWLSGRWTPPGLRVTAPSGRGR